MAQHIRSPKKVGRALQILELLESGLNSREVGEKLGLSPALVSYYKRNYAGTLQNNVVTRLRDLRQRKLDDPSFDSEDRETIDAAIEALVSPEDK